MDKSSKLQPANPHAGTAPHPLPQEVWRRIFSHISLRERQAIGSLACVHGTFTVLVQPQRKAAAAYQSTEERGQQAADQSIQPFLTALQRLTDFDHEFRLEIFLGLNAALHRPRGRETVYPQILGLLQGLGQLPRADRKAALHGVIHRYSTQFLRTSAPCYQAMTQLIADIPHSDQPDIVLAIASALEVPEQHEFTARLDALMMLIDRLPIKEKAEALGKLLEYFGCGSYGSKGPLREHSADSKKIAARQAMLFNGICACLGKLPMQERAELIPFLVDFPAWQTDYEAASTMVIKLLRLIEAGYRDIWKQRGESSRWKQPLGKQIEDLLGCISARDPQESASPCQRLHEAMAHLDPGFQADLMRQVLERLAFNAGVTPGLLRVTLHAACRLPDKHQERVLDLLPVLLSPGPFELDMNGMLKHKPMKASDVESHMAGFDANCKALMQELDPLPGKQKCAALLGMNRSQQDRYSAKHICAGAPYWMAEEKYRSFFAHANTTILGLSPGLLAELTTQWEMPYFACLDIRIADEMSLSMIAALLQATDHSGDAPVPRCRQRQVLCNLLNRNLLGFACSPVRSRRFLAATAGFQAEVRAGVLIHALTSAVLESSHYDVRFQCIVEAAGTLPAALCSSVLVVAANQLNQFPSPDFRYFDSGRDGSAMLQQREEKLRSHYPGLDLANRDSYDYVKPGFLSRKEAFFMVLQASAPLPDAQRADVLGVFCDKRCFFAFANGSLRHEEQADCSRQLMTEVLKLPAPFREPLFRAWVDHFHFQFQGTDFNARREEVLASLFALPPAAGRPLLKVYLDEIRYPPEQDALRRRASAHWSAAEQ